jgi:hypothetical protein
LPHSPASLLTRHDSPILGTGTSYGVPFVGCDCDVCTSTDPRDKRLRASIAVEHESTRLLVDTGPDLRQQLLRSEIRHVDALLWTHDHNDHIIGLDDVRPLSDRQGYIPGYANLETLARLQTTFDYALCRDAMAVSHALPARSGAACAFESRRARDGAADSARAARDFRLQVRRGRQNAHLRHRLLGIPMPPASRCTAPMWSSSTHCAIKNTHRTPA